MDTLICDCGKIFSQAEKFTVYSKNFCSIECLKKFKIIEDEKRKPKKPQTKYQSINYGFGSACC
ncbi:hypothetical protein [Acanthamoeba castellanii mimivirus]|uniref:Uncharacterized protein n=3 Tax=Mimivirus TaxID=315393 RepID=A0A0G2Y1B5_MIMIV|nr:hypothetical protein MIMI_gp0754 [Acanthamoeba polyphaga mimivirus]AEQ60907.1 hypothetical protein [Acanthamoeba castellanii mamavirus]AHA45138.1 hypothetical protein HIRU_S232 [Hirudovirus strain Sangsue]AHJ40323.1 hypothetical protein [Samba virus]BAV61827.1 hypothetical protein [Acanthamoeba castellanii mimivirus]ADO18351.1 hypothetical protein [Acanthamoeba polyphaga mimivirus]